METDARVRDAGKQRAVILTVTGKVLKFRLKGCRTAHLLPIASAYERALMIEVLEEKRKKVDPTKPRKVKSRGLLGTFGQM